jgi:hypothetical protein
MTLQALANVPRQDADCASWIGVNVYGSAARLEFTVAHRSMAAVRNRAARLKIVVAKSRNQGLGLKAKGR